MIVLDKIRELEDYEVQELKEKKLFINQYDLDLKYDYELMPEWKHFFFDIMQELKQKGYYLVCTNLFDYLKKNWYNIIKEHNLKVDINDYIDLVDYIDLEEWEKRVNHFLVCGDSFYLVEIR